MDDDADVRVSDAKTIEVINDYQASLSANCEKLASKVIEQNVSVATEATVNQKTKNKFDFIAPWIVTNFPDMTEVKLKSQAEGDATQSQTATDFEQRRCRCEECSTFDAAFRCDDTLCFRCTDAIHIIPSFSTHKIQFNRSSSTKVHGSPLLMSSTTPNTKEFSLCTTLSYQTEPRLSFPTGTHVFFRAPECSRWSHELLHGTLASCEPSTVSKNGTFYHRVLYIRGVETLLSGSFRAVLTLPGWDVNEVDTATYWPLELGAFTSHLGALRAVVLAEQIARGKFRREREGRYMNRDRRFMVMDGTGIEPADPEAFPSSDVLREIVAETTATLSDMRFTRQDDVNFYHKLSLGTWNFRDWMKTIGYAAALREEDAVPFEADVRRDLRFLNGSLAGEAMIMPWAPMTRIRFFLIAQHDLILPGRVCRQRLQAIVQQMLYVYTGFAWRHWRDYVVRHRALQETQRRDEASRVLQAWTRRAAERKQEKERRVGRNLAFESSIDALEFYRRQQLEARKLYDRLIRRMDERKRRALKRWRQASGPCARPPVPARTWHPSHGMKNMLPRLPRIGARRRTAHDKMVAVENQVVIEDRTIHKLFKANHTGPADTSYWVIRTRVLAGTCPVGPAFREARRLVSRTDFATAILLQQISVFVCLMTPEEIASMESGVWSLEGSYEHQVRTKYEALSRELKGAETVSKRYVTLAQQALDKFDAEAANVATGGLVEALIATNKHNDEVMEDKKLQARKMLEQKLQLAEQQAVKATQELTRLGMMQLEFLSFPIEHDGVPDNDMLMAFFANEIESRLRAGRNLYIFSRLGHGRTGLVAALLLGRIYGITASEALERAQAIHDCRRPETSQGLSSCSPSTASQLYFVRRALARDVDPIYASLVLENTSEGFRSTRVQQRGLLADLYMNDGGFMVSAVADASAREREALEWKCLERIAQQESESAALQRARQTQSYERDSKEAEEVDQIVRAVVIDIYDRIVADGKRDF